MGEQSLPPVSTPDYIGQNAIKALVRQDPQKWSDLAAQMYNQTPLQQAQAWLLPRRRTRCGQQKQNNPTDSTSDPSSY